MIGNLFAPIQISMRQAADLVVPWRHDRHVRRHRAMVVISRVQIVSAIFAVLVPAWLLVDMAVFTPSVWLALLPLRIGATAVFVALAWPRPERDSRAAAMVMLTTMVMVPAVFHLLAVPILAEAGTGPVESLVRTLYDHLPFTVVAGLSVFPLTALEVGVYWSLVLATMIARLSPDAVAADLHQLLGEVWLLLLIGGTAMISGMSQLQYMTALVRRITIDPLTGCLTRRAGAELLERHFRKAHRRDEPLALAFVDIDLFKTINDTFGHEAGDHALGGLGHHLRRDRQGLEDVIRWGGEEFLLILPGSNREAARTAIRRLGAGGLGRRPDGAPLTVSVGIAERRADATPVLADLIELADRRMYEAKRSGRNRAVTGDQDSADPVVP
jgi:diguanylate cyclase (GGDEF)-like protein